MTIERISDIERVPLAIDYRRMFRANLFVAIGTKTLGPTRIEFVLELSPFGSNEVSVNFLDHTDYPTIPAIRMLKEYVGELDRSGSLNTI